MVFVDGRGDEGNGCGGRPSAVAVTITLPEVPVARRRASDVAVVELALAGLEGIVVQ